MTSAPQPPGVLGTAWLTAAQTLQAVVRVRRVVTLLLLVLGYAAVTVLLGNRAKEGMDLRVLYCTLAWWLVGTAILPFASMYFGVQAVHGDIEDRTSCYLFVRPIDRTGLLLGKWAAAAVLAVVTTCLTTAAPFFALAAQPGGWGDGVDMAALRTFVLAFALGAVAYVSVAVLFGALFRRPLVWSALFVVGLQMVTGNLPVSAGLRRLTITDPMRRLVLDGIEPDQRLTQLLWPAERRIGFDQIGQPVCDLLVLTCVTLLLAIWRYRRAEYDSRARD